MPILLDWKPDSHSVAAVWKIQEPEQFFLEAEDLQGVFQERAIKHPVRKLEFLAGRFLLKYLRKDFPLKLIQADEFGKPRLPDNQYFFSISHSYPFVAAMISTKTECGLDIQTWKPQIGTIAHMFLSEEEKEICRNENQLFTLAWSVKEAVYKWNGKRGIDFIQDLPISIIRSNIEIFQHLNNSEQYLVDIHCKGEPIQPKAALFKDFSLAFV